MVVLFTTVTPVAAALPNVTVAPGAKLLPEIVTDVPPVVGPLDGVTLVTVGCPYTKPPTKLPLWPPLVTVTVTGPPLPAGVIAVMVVLLTTVTLVAEALPNVTVAPEAKLVPVIVTEVPPAVEPLFGLTPLTVGATTYVKPLGRVPLWPD